MKQDETFGSSGTLAALQVLRGQLGHGPSPWPDHLPGTRVQKERQLLRETCCDGRCGLDHGPCAHVLSREPLILQEAG